MITRITKIGNIVVRDQFVATPTQQMVMDQMDLMHKESSLINIDIVSADAQAAIVEWCYLNDFTPIEVNDTKQIKELKDGVRNPFLIADLQRFNYDLLQDNIKGVVTLNNPELINKIYDRLA